MERKIKQLEHCHVEVEVKVDAEAWKKAQRKEFEKALANVEVKGFRKGKAPEALAKERVNQGQVLANAVDSLLPELYSEVLKEEKLQPFAQPKVEVTKLTDEELEVKFVIVTAPKVELGEYKGLKVGKEEPKVTAKDVEEAVKALQERNATLVVKEDKAQEGDTVIMDFVGTVNGEAFEGGSAENYELVLGSHSFIPGFEEQLVGHGAGEHVDVNVTFPEQYTDALKGKPAVFACDIHEVKEKKLPELNNEFVIEQNIKDVESVEQLKEHLKAQKEQEAKSKAKSDYLNKLIEEIVKGSKLDIPEEMIDNQVNARKEDFLKRVSGSGLDLEQYLQIVGQKEEDFMKQLRETSIKDLSSYLVLEEIANKEELGDISDEELEFEYAKIAEQYNMKVDDVKKAIAPQAAEFKNNLKMSRVETLLFKNNN